MINIKVNTQGGPNAATVQSAKTYKKKKKVERYAEPVVPPLGIRRNAKCPCGSGKKFKKCHMEILNAPPIALAPNSEYTGSPEVIQFSEVSLD